MVMDGDDKMIIIMKMVMLAYGNVCDDCNDCNSEGVCKKTLIPLPHMTDSTSPSTEGCLSSETIEVGIDAENNQKNPSPLLYICFWSMGQLYCK